jgi:hypothetical protein
MVSTITLTIAQLYDELRRLGRADTPSIQLVCELLAVKPKQVSPMIHLMCSCGYIGYHGKLNKEKYFYDAAHEKLPEMNLFLCQYTEFEIRGQFLELDHKDMRKKENKIGRRIAI